MSEKLYTLEEAKKFLRANFEKGVDCPACGKFCKLYKYSILGETSAALIRLYRLSDEYHHINEFQYEGKRRASRWPELRFYGLVVLQSEEQPSSKHASGYWRITEKGRKFVEGKIAVRKYMLFYDKKPRGFEGDYIKIEDTLGEKFDYRELMGDDFFKTEEKNLTLSLDRH